MANEASVADWQAGTVALPAPDTRGTVPLEQTLARRRSLREFAGTPLSCAEVSQLVWAAQGVTDNEGRRTVPSAGARYPLEVLVVAGSVDGLSPGVYRYQPRGHLLLPMIKGDQRAPLAAVSQSQDWLQEAPAAIVITAVAERTTGKYGTRAERYVQLEAGHAAQNCSLQAVALGLGTVIVAAFDDARVKEALDLEEGEWPLCLLPVGRAQS